jgi:hypothetical protein
MLNKVCVRPYCCREDRFRLLSMMADWRAHSFSFAPSSSTSTCRPRPPCPIWIDWCLEEKVGRWYQDSEIVSEGFLSYFFPDGYRLHILGPSPNLNGGTTLKISALCFSIHFLLLFSLFHSLLFVLFFPCSLSKLTLQSSASQVTQTERTHMKQPLPTSAHTLCTPTENILIQTGAYTM